MLKREVITIKKLVERAKKGDKRAYLKLFQNYEEDIYRVAYVYVKNQNNALDIVQDTACKSFSQIKNLKNPEYFKTWLIKITINAAVDFIRKEKKVIHLKPEHTELISTLDSDLSTKITLNDLMNKLNENEKSIVILKFYYNHTFNEIADLLELPIGTIKTILYRSLDKMRRGVKKEDIYGQ
jgi:RNA polymerase sigma-70 factor (ECF subfamily)